MVEKIIENMRTRCHKKIDKLNAEIEDLQKRKYEDMSDYGVGGAYRRKEKAINKRNNQIKELKEFLIQLKEPVLVNTKKFDAFYCASCSSTFAVIENNYGVLREGWRECPCCRQMMSNPHKLELKLVQPKR